MFLGTASGTNSEESDNVLGSSRSRLVYKLSLDKLKTFFNTKFYSYREKSVWGGVVRVSKIMRVLEMLAFLELALHKPLIID